MCQAFEGEQNYLIARDRATRRRGYDAFKAGQPISSCTEATHENPKYDDRRQWESGWRTAERGGEPW